MIKRKIKKELTNLIGWVTEKNFLHSSEPVSIFVSEEDSKGNSRLRSDVFISPKTIDYVKKNEPMRFVYGNKNYTISHRKLCVNDLMIMDCSLTCHNNFLPYSTRHYFDIKINSF